MILMTDVKITVVAKLQPGEIFDELAAKNVKPICDAVETGKTYLSKDLKMPDGFCAWAWADIQRDVAHLALGGDFRWINNPEHGELLHRWAAPRSIQTRKSRVTTRGGSVKNADTPPFYLKPP